MLFEKLTPETGGWFSKAPYAPGGKDFSQSVLPGAKRID